MKRFRISVRHYQAVLFAGLIVCCGIGVVQAESSKIVHQDGYTFHVISDGALKGRIAWAFDTPGDTSNPAELLRRHLGSADDIIWASYKPTLPSIAALLNDHTQAEGVFDRNYCGKACVTLYGGNDRVAPVSLGIYNPKSKRKWFVMHHKFAVINRSDAQKAAVLTGSFNWNKKAASLNYENFVYIQSKIIADAYWREFQRITGKGGGDTESVSDGNITAGFNQAGTSLLVDRISKAAREVRVAVWSISVSSSKRPNPVYDALVAATKRGVDVRIITDAHKAKNRKYGDMNVIPAQMPSKKGHMHHKFIVIDNRHVVTGSYNFVTKAFSGNYENVLAVESPAMAASFTGHWEDLRRATR